MAADKADTLRVPGASLYYEMRGSGPLLLIVQGGDGDAQGSVGLVQQLVEHYTVVTYDRRGLSRSKLDDPNEVIRLETHSEDISHLLAALSHEPVLVYGNSIGALIGLDLVARHASQVRTLVAHEPPSSWLLSEPEQGAFYRAQEEIEETFRRDGVPAAMKKFLVVAGLNLDDREADVVLPTPTPQRGINLQYFLTHDAPAVRTYRLNLDALKTSSTRIVPSAGRSTRDTWPHHCASALANRLGTKMEEFPGGHTGHVLRPKEYAARLREILGSR
jgi:pimeloyl-ACP methyl ester carboxylesterase